jgi:hypothetical protein
MRGYDVPRRAGWDTHGLPVEIEVEKELRISGKDAIVAYGVEPFVRRCLESPYFPEHFAHRHDLSHGWSGGGQGVEGPGEPAESVQPPDRELQRQVFEEGVRADDAHGIQTGSDFSWCKLKCSGGKVGSQSATVGHIHQQHFLTPPGCQLAESGGDSRLADAALARND